MRGGVMLLLQTQRETRLAHSLVFGLHSRFAVVVYEQSILPRHTASVRCVMHFLAFLFSAHCRPVMEGLDQSRDKMSECGSKRRRNGKEGTESRTARADERDKENDWLRKRNLCVCVRESEIQARSCLLPPHFLELSKQAIKEMAQQEQWELACVMLSVWKKSCTWIHIHVVYWLSSQYIAFRETLSN